MSDSDDKYDWYDDFEEDEPKARRKGRPQEDGGRAHNRALGGKKWRGKRDKREEDWQ